MTQLKTDGARHTFFQPIKITCSKVFNLKTDVGTTNQAFKTTSQKTKVESGSTHTVGLKKKS